MGAAMITPAYCVSKVGAATRTPGSRLVLRHDPNKTRMHAAHC